LSFFAASYSMKSLCYAGYMAVFVVGSTLIAAAFVARHIIVASLIPDWVLAFIVVFVGGLMAARLRNPLFRIATLAVSAGLAWAMIESGMAYWPYHSVSINGIWYDILMSRFAIMVMAGWGMLSATIAEIIWRSSGFGRHGTPSSRSEAA
jgi:hypothetical protein